MKMLKFGASWCQPCKVLDEVFKYAPTDLDIERIDIDANPQIAMAYNVRSVPVCILVDEDTALELDRKTGVFSYNDMLNWLSIHR